VKWDKDSAFPRVCGGRQHQQLGVGPAPAQEAAEVLWGR
jgi:hypothetical protein